MLLRALRHYRAGDPGLGRISLDRVLGRDPGIATAELATSETPISDHLPRILTAVRFASTLSGLANVALATGETPAAVALFQRFLEVETEARDRQPVRAKLLELAALDLLRNPSSPDSGSPAYEPGPPSLPDDPPMATDPESENPFSAPLRDYDLNPYIHALEADGGYDGHLVAAAGRDFIDFHSAWGVNLLGYGYRLVARAIARQARRYAGFGIPQPPFNELRELLFEIFPWAGDLRFGKNGSEATSAAVRLSRAITGRERVLYRGYHSFHDWHMAATDCAGIPGALRELVTALPELTVEAVDRMFHRHPEEIACIIINPLTWPIPSAEEMREIVELTCRRGALMVFDEVVTGFRVALAGMEEIWGVEPDLACYGRASPTACRYR